MATWSTIQATEVLEEFTPAETATLNNIQGAATNLAGILNRVVAAVRGSIQAGGNPLGDAATIPDQLRGEVVALARWKWLASFPQLKSLQTPARKEAADKADDLLKLIASQKSDRPRVAGPDGVAPVNAAQKVSGNPRAATRTKLNGLV